MLLAYKPFVRILIFTYKYIGSIPEKRFHQQDRKKKIYIGTNFKKLYAFSR